MQHLPVNRAAENKRLGKRLDSWLGVDTTTKSIRCPLSSLQPLDGLQRDAVQRAVEARESIFLSGAAGTGKSRVLQSIIGILDQYTLGLDEPLLGLAITAMTGTAAARLESCTLHAWCGIGKGDGDVPDLLKRIRRNPIIDYQHLIRSADILIIDEQVAVNMLSVELFDKLDSVFRTVRRRETPFGGLQVIASGDFFQLPPVQTRADSNGPARYPFQSPLWDRVFDTQFELERVFRQQGDKGFLQTLEAIKIAHRWWQGDYKPLKVWQHLCDESRCGEPQFQDCIRLFAKRTDANEYNDRMLQKLPGESIQYKASDEIPSWFAEDGPAILAESRAEEAVDVKIIRNDVSLFYCNGSLGVVVDFMTCAEYVRYGGDRPDIDFHTPNDRDLASTQVWPVIEFDPPNGKGRKRCMLACAAPFREEASMPAPAHPAPEGEGESAAAKTIEGTLVRRQIPLVLAWALTVHKSEGQEFPAVIVDAIGIFRQPGMLYTALTRVASSDNIVVLNGYRDDPRHHFGNIKPVLEFYKELKRRNKGLRRALEPALATHPPEKPAGSRQTHDDDDDDDDDLDRALAALPDEYWMHS